MVRVSFLFFCLMLILVGCSRSISVTQDYEAPSLLPELNRYAQFEYIQDALHAFTITANALAIASGRSELMSVVHSVEKIANCYVAEGAVATKGYTDQKNKLSIGIVAIGDRNKITDPGIFYSCFKPRLPFTVAGDVYEYQICGGNYKLKTPSNTFYISFIGTTTRICDDLCKGLVGCSK